MSSSSSGILCLGVPHLPVPRVPGHPTPLLQHWAFKMAPTRRYLRITKHSVLEVRIYLERPSDSEGWFLRRDNPALPRVVEAVRPLVLPKLREENERASGRAGGRGKKKGVKDVVVGGMFYF